MVGSKGQLISKGLLGVIVWTKKPTKLFLRISALASKKREAESKKDKDAIFLIIKKNGFTTF